MKPYEMRRATLEGGPCNGFAVRVPKTCYCLVVPTVTDDLKMFGARYLRKTSGHKKIVRRFVYSGLDLDRNESGKYWS